MAQGTKKQQSKAEKQPQEPEVIRVPPQPDILSTEREEHVAEVTSRRKHPHAQRRAEIMNKHPKIAELIETNIMSAVYIVALVTIQYSMAIIVTRKVHWVLAVIISYGVGAIIDHSLWVLIHDASHNLVFSSVIANRLLLCVANIAHVLPSAMMFRYYHILHHIELNKIDKDPDVPASWEAKFVGNSPVRKALWLALFFLFQSVRMVFYTYKVPAGPEMGWIILNWVICLVPAGALYYLYGIGPLLYLLFASISAIGLHPLGARWIQEHYPTQPFQSTYSYYGPANRVAFNIGFHNEHHDFPSVPWNNLPYVKQQAPEYYDTLFAYTSYTKLMIDFIREQKWSLLVRYETEKKLAEAALAAAANGKAE